MIRGFDLIKSFRSSCSVVVLASALFALTGVAGATVINVSGGGALNLGNLSVQVTSSCINFYNGLSADACDATASDTFSVNPPIDAGLFVLNSTGHIKDVIAPGTNVSQFITTTGAGGLGTINFDLVNLIVPGASSCPPNTFPCVTTIGPFVFTGLAGGSNPQTIFSFTANLCAYITSPGTNCSTGTPYTGVFSSHFTGAGSDVATLITNAMSPGGITDSMSATLNPNLVPEPATTLLLGSGLLAIGMAVRRFRR